MIVPNSQPSASCRAVTPSDSVDLTHGPCRGLYVGTTGDLKVTGANDDDGSFVTIKGAAVGYHPLAVKRVWNNSGAADIVALY